MRRWVVNLAWVRPGYCYRMPGNDEPHRRRRSSSPANGNDNPHGSGHPPLGISYEDYAIALLDEIEAPEHLRARFTVGY